MNAELAMLGLATIAMDRVVDTLALARKKHPGPRPASTLFATATALTAPGGFATARCWTQRSWSRSIASYREASAVAPVGRRAGADMRVVAITPRSSPRPLRISLIEHAEANAHAQYIDSFGRDAVGSLHASAGVTSRRRRIRRSVAAIDHRPPLISADKAPENRSGR
jgi:DNA polymerase-3 subunit epsilon